MFTHMQMYICSICWDGLLTCCTNRNRNKNKNKKKKKKKNNRNNNKNNKNNNKNHNYNNSSNNIDNGNNSINHNHNLPRDHNNQPPIFWDTSTHHHFQFLAEKTWLANWFLAKAHAMLAISAGCICRFCCIWMCSAILGLGKDLQKAHFQKPRIWDRKTTNKYVEGCGRM